MINGQCTDPMAGLEESTADTPGAGHGPWRSTPGRGWNQAEWGEAWGQGQAAADMQPKLSGLLVFGEPGPGLPAPVLAQLRSHRATGTDSPPPEVLLGPNEDGLLRRSASVAQGPGFQSLFCHFPAGSF